MKHLTLVLILLVLLLSACTPTPRVVEVTRTATPTNTATLLIPTATAATPREMAEGERLAFIEGSQLKIIYQKSGSTIQVSGAYRQLRGWSPDGDYLLAIREDGENVVVGVDGKTLKVLNDLSQPAFWATPNEFTNTEDWLALPKKDGALELLSFPSFQTQSVLETGSLGSDGMADVRWGTSGEWIATPSLAQLQNQVSFEKGAFAWLLQNGPSVQSVLNGGSGGGTVSRDFHHMYFQVLDDVPGSLKEMPILLGFQVKEECSSCQSDGLELVSLNPWSETMLPQGLVMLNTREAYAWNPAQPGLLAIVAGGSRFTLEHKRLALFDVPAGQFQYLTGEDQVVYEPSWSPDGRRLAFTTLSAVGQPSGNAYDLEAYLGGRAIAVYDVQGKSTIRLTSPKNDAIDGWPRWSADGKSLIYARKLLANFTTEIHHVEIETGADTRLVSFANAPQACHRSGCNWERMLAYWAGKAVPSQEAVGPVLAPTPTPSILADASHAGWNTYYDSGYNFSFQYPADWKISDGRNLSNFIKVSRENAVLTIGYRRPNQQVVIQRTGVGNGDFVESGSVRFLGQTLKRERLIYGGKVKAVFYHSDAEFSAGGLVFTLGVDGAGNGQYEDVDIPQNVQEIIDRIIKSFQVK